MRPGPSAPASLPSPSSHTPSAPPEASAPGSPCLEGSPACPGLAASLAPALCPLGGHPGLSFLSQVIPLFLAYINITPFKAPTSWGEYFNSRSPCLMAVPRLGNSMRAGPLPVFFLLYPQFPAWTDAQHHLLAERPNGCRLVGAVTTFTVTCAVAVWPLLVTVTVYSWLSMRPTVCVVWLLGLVTMLAGSHW